MSDGMVEFGGHSLVRRTIPVTTVKIPDEVRRTLVNDWRWSHTDGEYKGNFDGFDAEDHPLVEHPYWHTEKYKVEEDTQSICTLSQCMCQ